MSINELLQKGHTEIERVVMFEANIPCNVMFYWESHFMGAVETGRSCVESDASNDAGRVLLRMAQEYRQQAAEAAKA